MTRFVLALAAPVMALALPALGIRAMPAVPMTGQSPTPTSTRPFTPPTGSVPIGNPTSTSATPSGTIPAAPTAAPSPSPTTTFALSGPTPESSATVQPPTGTTTPLPLQVRLAHAAVARGGTQAIQVRALRSTRITQLVQYADGRLHHAHATISTSGVWRHTWVVRARQPGRAMVYVDARLGGRHRHFTRSFVVR